MLAAKERKETKDTSSAAEPQPSVNHGSTPIMDGHQKHENAQNNVFRILLFFSSQSWREGNGLINKNGRVVVRLLKRFKYQSRSAFISGSEQFKYVVHYRFFDQIM